MHDDNYHGALLPFLGSTTVCKLKIVLFGWGVEAKKKCFKNKGVDYTKMLMVGIEPVCNSSQSVTIYFDDSPNGALIFPTSVVLFVKN